MVSAAAASADLEGHLALYVLQSGLRDPAGSAVRPAWDKLLSGLRASGAVASPPLRTPNAVAVLGVRLALGFDSGRAGEYLDLGRREFARSPMLPAPSVHDNERILLGVAAGTGAAAQSLSGEVSKLVAKRDRPVTLRQGCIDLFAEAVASGRPRLDRELGRRAYEHLMSTDPKRRSSAPEDYVAALWLASRLLDADWQPTDSEMHSIEDYIADVRRSVDQAVTTGEVHSAIDAAFALDAVAASPAAKLARRSALEALLAVVDGFAASAEVLRNRYAKRPPFEIKDEYDVQDMFFAFVLPLIPDMVPEDPASKVANKSSRLDFTSKSMGLGIELKHLRSRGDADRVRDEILVDEATYHAHPYVDTVVAFVHDPDKHIPMSARNSFEADLSKNVSVDGRTVRYIVRVE